MAWWEYLLGIATVLLLLPGAALLLPLRIFALYLREDRTDHLSLRLRIGFLRLRCELKDGEGKVEISGPPLVRRILSADLLPRRPLPGPGGGKGRWAALRERGRRHGSRGAGPQLRPLLKRVTWSHFDLELSWGLGDPAWTALSVGGGWALGSLLPALLQRYFSMATRPRLRIVPAWSPAGLRLRWEGEVSLSLYSGLKLWRVFKKIGGAASGSSSH